MRYNDICFVFFDDLDILNAAKYPVLELHISLFLLLYKHELDILYDTNYPILKLVFFRRKIWAHINASTMMPTRTVRYQKFWAYRRISNGRIMLT
jgi:hypothetical protein